MKRVVPRVAAEQDIDEAADFYVDEAGAELAGEFVEAVRRTYQTIARSPRLGFSRYADIVQVKGLRTRRVGRFPHLIFYLEREDHIDVWRVLHPRRDIPAQLADENS